MRKRMTEGDWVKIKSPPTTITRSLVGLVGKIKHDFSEVGFPRPFIVEFPEDSIEVSVMGFRRSNMVYATEEEIKPVRLKMVSDHI